MKIGGRKADLVAQLANPAMAPPPRYIGALLPLIRTDLRNRRTTPTPASPPSLPSPRSCLPPVIPATYTRAGVTGSDLEPRCHRHVEMTLTHSHRMMPISCPAPCPAFNSCIISPVVLHRHKRPTQKTAQKECPAAQADPSRKKVV